PPFDMPPSPPWEPPLPSPSPLGLPPRSPSPSPGTSLQLPVVSSASPHRGCTSFESQDASVVPRRGIAREKNFHIVPYFCEKCPRLQARDEVIGRTGLEGRTRIREVPS